VSKYGIVSLRHMGWQEMGDVLWAHAWSKSRLSGKRRQTWRSWGGTY